MSIIVMNHKWYSGISTVGFVLCYDEITGTKVCYTGCANNVSERDDIELIKGYGAWVEKAVAEAVFNETFDNYKVR